MQLDEIDNFVASCQQSCCKLIVKNLLSKGLLQAVSTSCNKFANNKLQET